MLESMLNGVGSKLQRWLAGVLMFGLVGTIVELLLLEHYEDAWQFVPLTLIALGMITVPWHFLRPTAATRAVLQVLMATFMAAGLIGVMLHVQGAAEFQREIDPTMDAWTLLTKALHAKAPPALAPGLMIQLGLIGLALTFTKESTT
jgi:hypothetical protein